MRLETQVFPIAWANPVGVAVRERLYPRVARRSFFTSLHAGLDSVAPPGLTDVNGHFHATSRPVGLSGLRGAHGIRPFQD